MDLFAFIRHFGPTKMRIREREPEKKEVKLLTLIEARTVSLNPPISAASGDSGDSIDKFFDEGNDDVLEETVAKDVSEVAAEKTKKKRKRKVVWDASGSTYPPKRLREDHHVVAFNTEGKSLAAIRDLVSDGFSVPSGVTEPPTVVFVPPTPDDGPIDSVFGLNLQTCPPSLRSPVADVPVTTVVVTTTFTANASAVPPRKVRVVSKNHEIFGDSASAGGANADVAGTSKLNEPADSSDSLNASQDLDSETLYRIYLRAMNYDQLYTKFNIGAARQIYLGAKVRMLAEHNLEQKDRLEDKCSEQTVCLSERDIKIAHLKSLLSLKEPEAAKVICLHGQISAIKATDAVKGNELRDLKERNFVLEGEKEVLFENVMTFESALSCDELSSKVASLESESDSLVEYCHGKSIGYAVHKGEIMEKRLSLTDVMVPLVEPLSSQSLIGEASTFAAPAMSESITTLSTTFASFDVVPPLSISHDQVSDNEDPPVVTFEKEELDTSSK
nr:hypothetical protein [Tanacetum cinerariifolium]